MTRATPVNPTPKLLNDICELVSTGSNLNVIGDTEGFPSRKAMYEWLKTNDDFSANYARAREGRSDWRASDMDKTIQSLKDGEIDYQTARLAIDNHKWQAGKENPKVYGDRTQIDHGAQSSFKDMLTELYEK